MFSEIDNIRKEINDSISTLEGGKEIKTYFGGYANKNEKVTRVEAEKAIIHFLEIARNNSDALISNYLYSEAQVLKDTMERVDQYTDEED